ncbi:MAG: FecR domain-containing protein [Anaerolineae bacterium]|nr:FecR domain-containing protein [Anaerolineae bacterium]
MLRFKVKVLLACVLVMGIALGIVSAQSDRAAILEVLSPGVEILRAGTENWIAVSVESVVGVGDIVRTDETGTARVTFFADGVDTDVLPNSQYRIDTFQGDDTSFTLRVSVLLGQTSQRLQRVLDAASSYSIETPGMTLAARGTEFAVRVEDTGRSGMLVSEGVVAADNETEEAEVPAEFGIRAPEDGPLSDVVRASTFDELDSALDGCTVSVSTSDDVSINVRNAPSLDAELIGYASAPQIDLFYGRTTTTGWYRIVLDDQYGWILSSSAEIGDCAMLREFTDDYVEDGASVLPQPTPEAAEETEPAATEEATEEAGSGS